MPLCRDWNVAKWDPSRSCCLEQIKVCNVCNCIPVPPYPNWFWSLPRLSAATLPAHISGKPWTSANSRPEQEQSCTARCGHNSSSDSEQCEKVNNSMVCATWSTCFSYLFISFHISHFPILYLLVSIRVY